MLHKVIEWAYSLLKFKYPLLLCALSIGVKTQPYSKFDYGFSSMKRIEHLMLSYKYKF